MKNLPSLPTLPMRSLSGRSINSFSNRPRGITSIARQTGKTSAFRQFGDSVSHTQTNERSNKIFGSISRAIKNKTEPKSNTSANKNNSINQNYKPVIK
jgi:hypothetical protein